MKIYPDPITDPIAFNAMLEQEFCAVLFNPDGTPNPSTDVATACSNRAECIILNFGDETEVILNNAFNPNGDSIDGVYTIQCAYWVCLDASKCISPKYCEEQGQVYYKCDQVPRAYCYDPCDEKSYFDEDFCACVCKRLGTTNGGIPQSEITEFIDLKMKECKNLGYDTYKVKVSRNNNGDLLENSCECGCFDGLVFDRTLRKCVSEDEDNEIGACCSMWRSSIGYQGMFSQYSSEVRTFFENTGCLYPTTKDFCYGRGTFYPGERCVDVLNNAECSCPVNIFGDNSPSVQTYGVWCSQDQECKTCNWYEQWDAENCVCSCSLDNNPAPEKCPTDPQVDFNPDDCICCPKAQPVYSANCG
jgi:hypothetical protein